jgi:hypothetical protein
MIQQKIFILKEVFFCLKIFEFILIYLIFLDNEEFIFEMSNDLVYNTDFYFLSKKK